MTGPRWSAGVLVALPAAGVVVVILLISGVLGLRMTRSRNSWDRDDGRLMALVSAGLLLGVLAGVGWGMWPWDARFHQWRPVSGVVQQTSARLIPAGDRTVQQRIVLLIDGKPYGCDDTRCALLQPGDTVRLACKPEWQFAGESGEACEFLSSSRTG